MAASGSNAVGITTVPPDSSKNHSELCPPVAWPRNVARSSKNAMLICWLGFLDVIFIAKWGKDNVFTRILLMIMYSLTNNVNLPQLGF